MHCYSLIECCQISIHLNGEPVKTLDYSGHASGPTSQQSGQEAVREGERGELARGDCVYRLDQLAYLRSGDKGNTANIGVYVCNYTIR